MAAKDELQEVATDATWGPTLDRYRARAKAAPFGSDEIRWGDARTLSLAIPGPGVVSSEFVQLVQLTHPARVWSVALGLAFVNNALGASFGDTLLGDFVVEFGVGSAKVDRFVFLNVIGANPVNVSDMTVPDLPAASITISARLRCAAGAGGPRVYTGRVSAMTAPVARL